MVPKPRTSVLLDQLGGPKGSPLDNLAGATVTDLRGFVLVRKRRCAGTPKHGTEQGRELLRTLQAGDAFEDGIADERLRPGRWI